VKASVCVQQRPDVSIAGKRIISLLGGAVHGDAESPQSVGSREGRAVGQVVANMHRYASRERCLGGEDRQRVALVDARRHDVNCDAPRDNGKRDTGGEFISRRIDEPIRRMIGGIQDPSCCL
jgi:hypothetical protein